VPLVSVVIPTLNRPKLLVRALNSVLRQTCQEFEIIVVADRTDEDTVRATRALNDARIRVVLNREAPTAAGARNTGADDAQGEWLAFLDDDDEWLPNKLERQLAHAAAARQPSILVSCLSRVVTPTGIFVRPKAPFDNSVPIDEYLFDRRTLFGGAGFIQTSSYLLPRSLFAKVRFDVNSPHDDWDFLLRLSKLAGARIETVPEIQAVVYFEEERPSLTTRTASWAASLEWLDQLRPLLTRRAYSGCCLGFVAERAAREGAYPAIPELLRRAFHNGSPRFWHVLPFLAYWLLPQSFRRRLRTSFRNPLRLPRLNPIGNALRHTGSLLPDEQRFPESQARLAKEPPHTARCDAA
jgi:Glycosyl transferase family 2